MTFLIKLAVYLVGALAFLAALVTPPAEPVANTAMNTAATSTPPLATSTPAASAPVATTTPKVLTEKKVEPFREVKVQPLSPPPIPVPFPPAPLATATPPISWNEINDRTRAALVNIICTTKRGGSFSPVSGGGIIIDPRGVILTNAHVAEYFLLKDYLVPDFVECVIRTGAPAVNAYRARLLYLAPQWIEKNAKTLTEEEASGTGENDFALLLIQESTRPGAALPALFPSLTVDWNADALAKTRTEKQALVAGYPAGFLGGITIQRDLYPVSSVAEMGKTFSFSGQSPDLIEISGSPLSQHGASGGAVVGHDGALVGIITTSSIGKTTSERSLHAITPYHIERSFAERNASSIQELFVSEDLTPLADEFNAAVAPTLTKLLEAALAPQ